MACSIRWMPTSYLPRTASLKIVATISDQATRRREYANASPVGVHFVVIVAGRQVPRDRIQERSNLQ